MFSDEVADLALSYVLSLARRTLHVDAAVRRGEWLRVGGLSLRGKTAGIIGLGGIGQAIALRCRAFGMQVVGHDVVELSRESLRACGAEQTALESVLKESDFLVLACNLTDENRHMINRETLQSMKNGAYLVNVARGPLVDENALIQALASGQIAGAGLDVFETEPLPESSLLRRLSNCLLGSHGGSSTAEAIRRVNETTIAIALAAVKGNAAKLNRFNRVA